MERPAGSSLLLLHETGSKRVFESICTACLLGRYQNFGLYTRNDLSSSYCSLDRYNVIASLLCGEWWLPIQKHRRIIDTHCNPGNGKAAITFNRCHSLSKSWRSDPLNTSGCIKKRYTIDTSYDVNSDLEGSL